MGESQQLRVIHENWDVDNICGCVDVHAECLVREWGHCRIQGFGTFVLEGLVGHWQLQLIPLGHVYEKDLGAS